jgi:hypothetical protein
MNPPAEYHMVLDGQQRLQSLLLAAGGDIWGFEDRDWNEEIKNQRPVVGNPNIHTGLWQPCASISMRF